MTKPFVDSGKLVVIAVAQEQHPDRTRLYAQWKNLKWKMAYDPLNQLALRSVPMGIAIDENGKVASRRVNQRFLSTWMNQTPESKTDGQELKNKTEQSDLAKQIQNLDSFQYGKNWKSVAPNANWKQTPPSLDEVVDRYKKLAEKHPKKADLQFRLGVAYRMRYDLAGNRNQEDFQTAVSHWTKALELDPNHYIFRRRIQQYGPRLEKPYPFYDWVEGAVKEIEKRGEKPVALVARLTGSEIARPARSLQTNSSGKNPDPDKKINQVHGQHLNVHVIVVPSKVQPGRSARVHVKLLPPPAAASWNDEAGPSLVWTHSDDKVKLSKSLHTIEPNGKGKHSNKEKTIELEVQVPRGFEGNEITIPAYALAHLCQKDDGVCYYGRKDFTIKIPVEKKTRRKR